MATPQDNYIVPGRAGFIGQVGNLGSANGLAGGAANASVGGTATNGVQSSNAATSAAFAVVQTVGGPAGMKAGGGASAPAASTSSFQPAAIQQDVAIDKRGEEPVQFTGAQVSPAATSTNENFPKSNKVAELPSPVGFNKDAVNTTLGTAGTTGKADYRGITNTVANAGENDLTLTQVDNFGQAKVDPNKKLDGAAQDGQLPPLYRPANEPGGQGPNYANAPKLAGNRSNSSLLPDSNG
jgi:hypothetical protein